MTDLVGGITGLFMGPPGTGKSTLLGSVAEVPGISKALLLAPKPREVNSFMYRRHRDVIDTEVFHDAGWAPAAGMYNSGAFKSLYTRVLSLYEDDVYDAVLVDPFTDVVWLAAHELLEPEQAEAPRDLRDSMGFYGALKYKMKGFTQSLVGLAQAAKKPKHVFVAVHVQPTKEDQQLSQRQGGGTKESSDNRGKGIEFMGEALPMIEGGYRREIAGEFDVVGYSLVQHKMELVPQSSGTKKMQNVTKYVVQLNADPERHAKAAIVPRLQEAEISNSLTELFRLIEDVG